MLVKRNETFICVLLPTTKFQAMSNGSNIDVSGAVNTLLETAGKVVQLPIDLLNNGIKTAVSVIEPATKTATDLALNILNTLSQVLQNISSVIAPKK